MSDPKETPPAVRKNRDDLSLPDRRVGISRFFELMGRDLVPFYKASFLFLLGVLPAFVLVYFGVMADSLFLCLCGGLLGGIAGGPLLCGMFDTVLRALRDEADFWWFTYKKAWKNNWKQSLLPGIVMSLLLSSWIWVMMRLPDQEGVPTLVWVSQIVGIVLFLAVALYFYCQLVLVNLPTLTILKNCAGLLIGFFPYSLAAALVSGVYWALILMYMPYTVPVVLVLGIWFPATVSLMCLYPALNKTFTLESRIAAKHDREYSDTL